MHLNLIKYIYIFIYGLLLLTKGLGGFGNIYVCAYNNNLLNLYSHSFDISNSH